MTTSVFVSGATGYIAQHIIKLLISKGYNVVGSVRTAEKGERLKKLLNSKFFSYEIVPAIETKGAFNDALRNHPEVTIFLHTASPAHLKSTDIDKEMYRPAIEGTKNVLSAIQAHGPQITNVVVTSSYAAMSDSSREEDPAFVQNEESWNPITLEEGKENPLNGYCASKTFAEKAVWDFADKESPGFKVAFVNPVLVFGPQAFDSEVKKELNFSAEIVNNLLQIGSDAEVPPISGGFVDVRDVAKAHLIAFEKNLANERLFLVSNRVTGQDIVDVINQQFPDLEGTIPVGNIGIGEVERAGRSKLENSKTRELLGFSLTDLKTSVGDSVRQILRAKKEV